MNNAEYDINVNCEAMRNELGYAALRTALNFAMFGKVENDATGKLLRKIFVVMLDSMKKNGIDAEVASRVLNDYLQGMAGNT